ncbi:hypothetical protein AB0D27_21435 [Streptomyces sp. NPDC048415]|uniref:hypothetical protein n=1 Tax=Streptomyces sp. NPDC048415 TaxID=3154822 RepID=UPI00341CCB47
MPSPPKSFDFFDTSADTATAEDTRRSPGADPQSSGVGSPREREFRGLPAPSAQDIRRSAGADVQSSGAASGRERESGGSAAATARESRRFPELRPEPRSGSVTPPPPAASARFPDAPPAEPRRGTVPEERPAETTRRLQPVPAEEPAPSPAGTRSEARAAETTRRLRPIPAEKPAPVPVTPSATPSVERPFVSFAEPERYDDGCERRRVFGGRRMRPRTAAAAACVVLGLGLIGGAVTGSWLTGDDADGPGSRGAFAAAGELWHSVPVDQLFPPTVRGDGAGPGGADRTWTRVAVAPDTGCKDAFDPLLRKALAPVGCLRLLRATYTDATRSHVTTVGLLFTKADATAMTSLKTRFQKEGLDRRTDLMPRPYAAEGTVAEGFGNAQRASWTVSVLTDAPVVVYAVSGFADARAVSAPQPAADAMKAGATTAPAQAGLGHEAQGLADRVERALRKTVTSATEKPS